MGKISTLDFVRGYEAQLTEDSKRNFVKSHVVVDYVPMMRKIAIGENLVKSFYKKNPVTGKDEYHYNTVYYDILYTLNIINEYTDIQVDFLSAAKEYENFDKYGLQEIIFEFIPKRELQNFANVSNWIQDDAYSKEYNVKTYLESKFEAMGLVVDRFLDIFKTAFQEQLGNLSPEEMNGIKNAIENIISSNSEKQEDQ